MQNHRQGDLTTNYTWIYPCSYARVSYILNKEEAREEENGEDAYPVSNIIWLTG